MDSERKDKAFLWSEMWQKTEQTKIRFYNKNKQWCVGSINAYGDLELNLPECMNKPSLNRKDALEFADWIKDIFK